MQRQRSKTKPCREIAKGEPVLVRDYRDNNKWKQGVIVHKLGPVTYQVQVGDLIWKRHIDQIREFVPQENKDIPNILENTKSDIDTELIIVPTCNSNRDTENSENNNESERTKITENKTVENANDTIITRRSERKSSENVDESGITRTENVRNLKRVKKEEQKSTENVDESGNVRQSKRRKKNKNRFDVHYWFSKTIEFYCDVDYQVQSLNTLTEALVDKEATKKGCMPKNERASAQKKG
ncbi:unnamed protein product [Mytilus coruscus]|uniref:DUF5641 domain-containing protein n=1 Tax=Mytilus coruscus TaxID=42192 RepID=A0A6J8CAF8_MYTCO|nr:unnamed protein product [Mytilus coruscus]